MLILSHKGAQPLGINPSAAPSDLGNPSSIILPPARRTFGIRAPSTQLRRRPRFHSRAGFWEAQHARRQARARSPRCRVSPPSTGHRGAGSRQGSWRSDGSARLSRAGASEQASTPRGRAESLRYPSARRIRLSVVSLTETRNSSQTHIARSFSRQRTIPWIAGIGPLSTIAARASRWAVFSLPGWPGTGRSASPSGPYALNPAPNPGSSASRPRQRRPPSCASRRHRSRPVPKGDAPGQRSCPPSHPAQASGVIVPAKCKPRPHGESPISPPSIPTRELLGSPQ